VPDAEIALSAVARGLLGLLWMPAAPDRVIEATVDQLADADLRLLGVPSDEAPASSSSLPDTGAW